MNAPIHDPSACETQPPPPMPRMSKRDDSPRLMPSPGPESRYWRARAALEQPRRMTRDEWFACTDPYALVAELRADGCEPLKRGEDSDGACRTPGCCGVPMLTCDEIREEWEGPEPTLTEQLTASVAIAEAVARIAELPSRSYDPSAAACPCGGDESERLDDGESVLDLAIAIPLRRVRCCSVRCAAVELLCELHPTQDQSAATVERVMGMIERGAL